LLYSLQMAAITLKLPEELAARVRNHEDRLPEILEHGLRVIEAETEGGFPGAPEVLEFLAGLPSPQEILELRPAECLTRRVAALLEKNRSVGLTAYEEREWENYEFLEHLVTMAKAKAYLKLGLKSAPDA